MTAPAESPDPLTHRVLSLLVIGAPLRSIARSVHLSPRSVDDKIAQIKQLLDTAERFCLGVRAVRDGYVHARSVITHAQERRPGPWAAPNDRQRDIIALSADGASLDEVAMQLGVSSRTARHDLTAVCMAHGVRTRIAAGALFEALGYSAT